MAPDDKENLSAIEPPENVELVFLIGMPRSGTTWITWLLTHHPQVVTFRHSGMFYSFEHLQKWWTREIKFTDGGKLDAEGAYATRSSADVLQRGELRRYLRSIGSLVFHRLTAETAGVRAVVDQTPEHLRLFPFIREVFPEARFLHVVRDPRAVYSSIRHSAESWAKENFPRNPIPITRRWKELVCMTHELRQDSEHYYELAYEKIHAEPERELAALHDWIGLESSEDERREAIDASGIEKLRQNTGAPHGFFRRGSAKGWQEELSASETRLIEHIAGDEMRSRGYDLLHPQSAKIPLRLRSYDATKRLVSKRRNGRLMRFFEGTMARTTRAIELMRSE